MYLIILAAILALAGAAGPTPWEPAEHRMLADSVLQTVLSELGDAAPLIPGTTDSRLTVRTVILDDRNFGRLTGRLARDDGAASRFQEAGRAVFEQLREVSEQQLRAFWERIGEINSGAHDIRLIEPDAGSAVGNYLLAHVAALRYARLAGSVDSSSRQAFFLMLSYESMAQGFLADAHAAGHLLVPRHDAFQALHPVNNARAHDYYGMEGVFVVNGRHEAWETFGDGTLKWYARSYRQVLEACVTSLREVLLAYYTAAGSVPRSLKQWVESFTDRPAPEVVEDWLTSKSGGDYYETYASMPALSYIPMPVSAAWSIRSDARDRNGVRLRKHYPQFLESGYHDATLPSAIRTRLYEREQFPARFVPGELMGGSNPALEAEANRDAASVEFYNVSDLRPDYAGLLTGFGAGMLADDDRSAPAVTGRLGYGLIDNILLATHLSVNIGITKSLEDDFVSPVTATFGLNPAGLPLRGEIGYVTTTDDFGSESGLVLSAAYDVTSQVLGITYVGAAVRLGYTVMFLDDALHAPSISIAFY